MRIDMTGEAGDPGRPNEDYASAALPSAGEGGALVVLDGVTPPQDGTGCTHGVPWFTARLGGALLELATSRRELTLRRCLSEAISRTAAEHSSTCDLSHRRTPQATVVTARWDERSVEYLVLSDSVLVMEHPHGSVTPVLDSRLHQLPPHIGSLRRRVRELPEDSAERGAARAEYANAVEALRNAPGGEGFYTAAADPAVASLAVTGSAPRAEVRALLALTDGAARWSEVFRLGDWTALLGLVREEGSEALVARVREAERADPHGAAHPRGKTHDDASVVFAELGTGAQATRPTTRRPVRSPRPTGS
ncbi:protein phosphatase 2C domain-containing protein [Streptomyces sp. WMMB 322]|uniref:protein phosphatase 2C domain-containing protein n=1 Tax=Streptomyces sp. WMMB 322 TaxID=1286821 RepID=UPI0006E2B9CE|nr:protein phosphatase 2C domain-containing protein [Streptomyces sp. WMMB 322]SCK31162.1 Protein phosphatase 2C [Streptomyces sp. WMMB 322]